MYFVVAYAYSGLSPVRARPWRANSKGAPAVSGWCSLRNLNMVIDYFKYQYFLIGESSL